jgi:hypothetical protein
LLARALVAAVAVCAWLTSIALPALADGHGHPPVTVGGDYHSGTVTTVVVAPGNDRRPRNDGSRSITSSSSVVTCRWIENSAYVEDTYLNLLDWGKPGGHWYDIKCSDDAVYRSIYVPPAANNVPPAVVVAGTLAQQAVNRLQLPIPALHVNPSGQALVGLPEWFWVDARQWKPLRQRTQAGPVWARVTATPVSTSWDPGEGSPAVSCPGPGTPYDPARPASAQRSDCTFTYTRSSAGQPQTGPHPNDRYFTATVTMTWSVSWVGAGGLSGTLPAITRSASFPIAVAEREAVVTAGSG